MRKPLMRIPYTEILAPPTVVPSSATTLSGAVAALQQFFEAPLPSHLDSKTTVLTGAGLSVDSGLADYRGVKGTYRVNKTYRPIYHHEFVSSHEARKRYWARSFFGWTSLQKALPNNGHYAVRDLASLGLLNTVITQNVDSFHPKSHPEVPTVELHGYLRSTVCTTCKTEFSREDFQAQLARLNPQWAESLQEALASGALDTEDPTERRFRGLRTNPDGDVDVPNAPYTTFRYPACSDCLSNPPLDVHGQRHKVEVDLDGAWASENTAGVLKPAVVMFGESIAPSVKTSAEDAIDKAGRLLILGTSLATYSAWRLAKRAKERGMPLAIVNIGGVRGEDQLVTDQITTMHDGSIVRVELPISELLPALVSKLRAEPPNPGNGSSILDSPEDKSSSMFKDMMS